MQRPVFLHLFHVFLPRREKKITSKISFVRKGFLVFLLSFICLNNFLALRSYYLLFSLLSSGSMYREHLKSVKQKMIKIKQSSS